MTLGYTERMKQGRYSRHAHNLRQQIQRIRATTQLPGADSHELVSLPSAPSAGSAPGVSVDTGHWRPDRSCDGTFRPPFAKVIGPAPADDWQERARKLKEELAVSIALASMVKP